MADPSPTPGGTAQSHPKKDPLPILVAPTTQVDLNTIKAFLIPVGCWRVDDVRFAFDSSVIHPDAKAETAMLDTLRKKYPGAPLSIFGHADPTGSDDYNKTLSGRRATAVYAMLTRDVAKWEKLYSPAVGGDNWGLKSIQLMINEVSGTAIAVDGQTGPETQGAIKDYQKSKGLPQSGSADQGTRAKLFADYMDHISVDAAGAKFQLQNTDFLAKGADPDGKGDYQGCGEFNPFVVFSNDETNKYKTDLVTRNNENAPNRRVMALLFKPGTVINTAKWPCPKASEGVSGCIARFWKDGDKRRNPQDARRKFEDTKDTYGCRFYHRLFVLSPCESACAADFVINAPCRIVKAGGGKVQISAIEQKSTTAPGTYVWTTTSTKIRLLNADTSTVTVEGLANPSTGRDAEMITVTRTNPGCPPVVKTVNVTVARVTFSAAPTQRYGYDDFDTPANHLDDHVSVKKSDYTFVHVTIEGGAVGTDFNFVCEPAGICTAVAPGATASFDLRLNGESQNKAQTTLHARCTCPSATSFTNIEVHVYNEILGEVVVAKIQDNAVGGTALHYPNLDPAGHTAAVNNKVKEAVIKFDITNYSPTNGVTSVAYDGDGNGALSFDINGGGGAEVNAISGAMTGTGTKVRVAIVKSLKSYYFLSVAAARGDTTLTVRGGGDVFSYVAFPDVPLGLGANQEQVHVASVSGSTITLSSGVTKAHAVGTPIEFIAGGWSSDPIILTEESPVDGSLISESNILWSIPHETCHRQQPFGNMLDIDDVTDIMNFQQGGTDHRLRYCPRNRHYNPPGGTENQWELIPRV